MPTHDTPHPPTRRLIDSCELRALWPVGRNTFHKTIRQPDFPCPVQLLDGGDYLWYADEVEAWLETRRRRPGDRPAPPGPAPEPAPVLQRRTRTTRGKAPSTRPAATLRPRSTRTPR